jgi:hypothetical protein
VKEKLAELDISESRLKYLPIEDLEARKRG